MFNLLDVAPLPSPIPSRCSRRVIHEAPEPHRIFVDSVKEPVNQAPDTVSNGLNAVNDSLSSLDVVTGTVGGDSSPSSMLIWAILIVLVALIACFVFIYKYRKHQLA